jgi:H+/gluconate symporter-like permease
MAALMFLRKLPAIIALPIMAVLIALTGGVSPADTVRYVIGAGSLKLFSAYTICIFGSMLSVLLQRTGVAENFIKKGAELSGDNPWTIAVVMLSLIIVLFSTLGGLGAIIMVATIVLPIMASVGIGPLTTVGIFLFGLSIGGILNVGNWAVYISVMGLNVDQIRPFALVMFCLSFFTAVVYITIQMYRDGNPVNIVKIVSRSAVAVAAACLVYYLSLIHI